MRYINTALFVALAICFGVVMLRSDPKPPAPKVKTRVVFQKIPLSTASVRAWMLKHPVENAWVGTPGGAGKADCFVNAVGDDKVSIFSYCKLRMPLYPGADPTTTVR